MSDSRSEEGRPPLRTVVISRPGAAIFAEMIILDDDMRRRLTTNVGYLPPPPGSKLKR
jgi:hypothetical protein